MSYLYRSVYDYHGLSFENQISDDEDSKADGQTSPRFRKPSRQGAPLALQTTFEKEASYRFTVTGAILLSGFASPIPQSGLASAAAAAEAAEAAAEGQIEDIRPYQDTAPSEPPTSNCCEQYGLSLQTAAEGSGVAAGVETPMQDRVVLLGKLGVGTTGVVYRAFDLLDLRLVAVKVIPVHDQHKRRQVVHELSSLYDGLKARRRTKHSAVYGASSSRLAVVTTSSGSPRHDSWTPGDEKEKATILEALPGSENLVDFIDVFVSREAATLSLVLEYMDGGSLQVRPSGVNTGEVDVRAGDHLELPRLGSEIHPVVGA